MIENWLLASLRSVSAIVVDCKRRELTDARAERSVSFCFELRLCQI